LIKYYRTDGDITTLFFENRKQEQFACLIDTVDLERVLAQKYKWYVCWYKEVHSYYVRCSPYLGYDAEKKRGRYGAIYLHQYIKDIKEKNVVVDHENHNTLDCRNKNLRVTKDKYNTKHRRTKNTNNTSGHRNVTWDKYKEQWLVQLQIDGRNTQLGWFDDVDEAGKYAEEMRQIYYKEFAGGN
jgi:hypothetical protein